MYITHTHNMCMCHLIVVVFGSSCDHSTLILYTDTLYRIKELLLGH